MSKHFRNSEGVIQQRSSHSCAAIAKTPTASSIVLLWFFDSPFAPMPLRVMRFTDDSLWCLRILEAVSSGIDTIYNNRSEERRFKIIAN